MRYDAHIETFFLQCHFRMRFLLTGSISITGQVVPCPWLRVLSGGSDGLIIDGRAVPLRAQFLLGGEGPSMFVLFSRLRKCSPPDHASTC